MVETERKLTVAKKPLGNLPAERRTEIAQAVLARYMQGEQVAEMSKEYGTSDVTIYALILREHQEEWRDIQTARALARLERSQDELRIAPDALSLARAREQVRSAQWELERLLRRLYGEEKAQINVSGEGVKIELVTYAAQHYDNKALHNDPIIQADPVGKSKD